MQNLSHYSRHPSSGGTSAAAAASLSKNKSSCSNGGATSFASASKSVYDDVFGGPPKSGHPTLSPRPEDYAEIFGAFHAPRASSIPVLDLPSVDGEAEMFFDVRSSGFDYREVFGGFSSPDFAVSYDELVRMDRSNAGRGCSSSDEAWTPEGAEYLSEESDDPAKDHFMSNGDFYDPVDGSLEFNISYHNAAQTNNGDLPNGTTHVAPLHHAFPGYAVKVEKSSSLQPDDEYPALLVSDDGHLNIDFSGEMLNGRHLKKTMSHPSFVASAGTEIRPQKEYNRNISLPGREFVTITEFSLQTEPSHLPPPARPPPPPAVDVKIKTSDKLGVPSHKVAAHEQISSVCSPPYFDVEVDASSAAAASAAAMKEAMEKAQAKLKSAKESLERKRDGSHRRAGSGSRTGRGDTEGKGPKVAGGLGIAKDENVHGKEENGGEFFSLTETQDLEKKTDPVSDSLHGNRANALPRTAEEMNDRASVSSQGYDDIDGGEWKEAAQFFELVREKFDKPSGQANDENVPLQNINANGHEKKGKKVATDVLEHQCDWNVKQGKVDSTIAGHGKKLDMPNEEQRCQITQEAPTRVENDKKSRKHWQRPVETGKKHSRGDGLVKKQSAVDIQLKESTLGSKHVMKHREEEELLPKWVGKVLEGEIKFDQDRENSQKEQIQNFELPVEEKNVKVLLEQEVTEKKQKEGKEREKNERKRKEALLREENERRLIEDLERLDNERRIQETIELEENERKLRDLAIELAESERKCKETLEKEEKMRKAKEVIEQAENDKKKKEAIERAENDKKQIEENEKRRAEALEKEEEWRPRVGSAESEDMEKGQEEEEVLRREEKVNETFEQEQKGKIPKEAFEIEEAENPLEEAVNEAQVVEDITEEFYNVELLQKLDEVIKETTISPPQEVEDSQPVREAECETSQLGCISEEDECEEVMMKHKSIGDSESEEPHSFQYPAFKLGEDKKLEEAEVPIGKPGVFCYGVNEKTPSDPELGGKLAVEKHEILEQGQTELSAEDSDTKNKAQCDIPTDAANFRSAASVTGNMFANDKVESEKNANKEETREDSPSAKETIDGGIKTEGTQPLASSEVQGSTKRTAQQANVSQTMERKVKNINQPLPSDGIEAARLKREKDMETERLRKMEEEREREREREKDRMAVDRAILESREKAYAEAREKAERAAVERAMNEARERLEKACAEARERSLSDKTAGDPNKFRAAEARGRGFERARAERTASFGGNNGRQSSSSSSEAQFQNATTANGYRNTFSSAQNGSNRGERSEAVEGESAERCKARLERYRRTADRAAKALADKNMRDVQAQREQAERNRLSEALDAEVKRWCSGKEGNLRALLSTLQYILGADSGWQPIPLTEVITAAAVKRGYRKATLCVHPDKLQQRGASIQQKYICEKVFDLLKEAWNRFNSEER
ncbi:unnamed protein product [Linum tenue]|uniref:J domain-containing protein n=1 Tax=Linum tenue TaxID=586396 RepID=A0AAV0I505_9ROSI|nr:unnamed protein product [Linum tenue]